MTATVFVVAICTLLQLHGILQQWMQNGCKVLKQKFWVLLVRQA